MKILHVVALIQASTGGPAVSVTRLASEQAKMGHDVTLACLDYPHLGPQVEAEGVRVLSVKGNFLAVRGRGWSPKFRRVVMEEARNADVVHNHGLWMWPNAYAREAAVAAGKPLIISPRGMLEAWSLGRSKLRKAVAWRLFEKRNLQSAAFFHATAESERKSIEEIFSHSRATRDSLRRSRRQINTSGEKTSHGWTRIDTDSFSGGDCLGAISDSSVSGSAGKSSSSEKTKKIPIVVAANGVDLPDLGRRPGREILETKFRELKGRRWVVFMSRLHPKKGIDVLLRAWARQKEVTGDEWRVKSGKTETPPYRNTETPHREAVLVLAGSDLIGYGRDIQRMIKELGLEDSVVMTGEVRGEMKDALLANADVFVLPSYSENFGIVVAEAMAWGRPVIASTGTPWKDLADVSAGWRIAPEEEVLAGALAEAIGKGREELDAMGAKGRALVERSYTWAEPAAKLVRAYEEIVGAGGQKTKRRKGSAFETQKSAH